LNKAGPSPTREEFGALHKSATGIELPVLKPLTCMPGIYEEADADLESRRAFHMEGAAGWR